MLITFGKDYFEARDGRFAPVRMDTSKLINGHALLLGASGMGKSHTIKKMIRDARQSCPTARIHVFDVHGDLDIEGASTAAFSQTADFGLNPLRVDPDPDYGGVPRCIEDFISTINDASLTPLGGKQESVLRNLLLDVYRNFGFDARDSQTWKVNALETRLVSSGADNRLYLEVPLEQKDEAKRLGARWEPMHKLWWVHSDRYRGDITRWRPAFRPRTYPGVEDVLRYAQQINNERFLGSDQEGIQALHALNRAAKALQRRTLDHARAQNQGIQDDGLEGAVDDARHTAIAAYTRYCNAIRTGLELESLQKYDSPEVLKSVSDRLGNFLSTGLFRAQELPLDGNNPVWRYKMDALRYEAKKMAVLFKLQDIFSKAVARGQQADVVEVVVLDELSTYTSKSDEKGDGIIGRVSREARKFGLALWAADQSPADVPESLIKNVGTKIVLGLPEADWPAARNKMRMDDKLLAWVQPTRTIAVQTKEKGSLRQQWRWVQLT